jgi:ATP-binding cassette subfamily F protein 3
MLQIKGLGKFFGDRTLFENATMVVNRGERIALFGRNGSGKSTLFKIICGEDSPDAGEVSFPKGYTVGYLKQHLTFTEPTIIDEACLALTGDREMERYKAEIILEGLGFSESDLLASPSSLSGGFQIRINLAKLILSEPNMLLLDEPTNYLDIVSLRWLERYLSDWEGEMMIVSHDRAFCDAVSTHSVLVYRSSLKKVAGPSEKLFTQVAEEEELYERTRQNREKQVKKMEAFINRFKAKASKASVVQSRVKALEKIDRLDELSEEATLDFAFNSAPFPGRFPIEVTDLSFGYDPNNPLVSNLSLAVKKDDRVGVIGKNGRGKSTLLRLLAADLGPLSGKVVASPNAKIALFGQTNVNRLNLGATVEEEIRSVAPMMSRTQVRGICGAVMFEGDDALKKVKVLSGGERSRVLLGKILASPNNVLLLDEPTNHLDVESVFALTEALESFDGAVVVVTHDEELLRRVATRLVVFQGDAPFVFEGTYDEFLERVGWDGEEGVEKPSSKKRSGGDKTSKPLEQSAPTPSLKDSKREKAQLLQERSKGLNPRKNTIEKLEKEISETEKAIAATHTTLALTATDNTSKAKESVVSLGMELARLQEKLEGLTSSWETESEALAALEREYDEKLKLFG